MVDPIVVWYLVLSESEHLHSSDILTKQARSITTMIYCCSYAKSQPARQGTLRLLTRDWDQILDLLKTKEYQALRLVNKVYCSGAQTFLYSKSNGVDVFLAGRDCRDCRDSDHVHHPKPLSYFLFRTLLDRLDLSAWVTKLVVKPTNLGNV